MEFDNMLIGIIVLLLIGLFYMKINNKDTYRFRYRVRPMMGGNRVPMISGQALTSAPDRPPIQSSKPSELAKKVAGASKTQDEGEAGVQVPRRPSPVSGRKLEMSKMTTMWNVLKSDPDTDDTGRIQIKTTTDMATPLSFALARNCECSCTSGTPLARNIMFERNAFLSS